MKIISLLVLLVLVGCGGPVLSIKDIEKAKEYCKPYGGATEIISYQFFFIREASIHCLHRDKVYRIKE